MKRSCIFLAMGLALTTMARAQAIPDGPYKETCRNIQMAGTTLRAECETGAYIGGFVIPFTPLRKGGSPVFNNSELANANLCKSVASSTGNLTCAVAATPRKK